MLEYFDLEKRWKARERFLRALFPQKLNEFQFQVLSEESQRLYVEYEHLLFSPADSLLTTPPEVHKKRSGKRSVSLALRFKVMKRDGFVCRICGATSERGNGLEVDHKIPVDAGGGNDEDNLWTLCFDCNRGKSNQSL